MTFTQGVLKGQAAFAGEGESLLRLRANLDLRDATFSDAEGLHAGEKVGGTLALHATRDGDGWAWNSDLRWTAGEVFWQPFYLAQGGLSFQGGGVWSDTGLTITKGRIALREVGQAELSAEWRRPGNALQSMTVAARGVDMAGAYPLLIKPLMEKTLLGNLEMAGQADLQAEWKEGALANFDVKLHAFDVADREGRFARSTRSTPAPWANHHPRPAELRRRACAEPAAGRDDLAATLNGYSLTSPDALAYLDGELTLKDVSPPSCRKVALAPGCQLVAVSMADFSHAVGWPVMQGKVAASILMVTYSNGRMMADGR